MLALPALAEDGRISALIRKSEAEERARNLGPAIAILHEAEKIEPQNLGVLLRLSKVYADFVDDAPKADSEKHARRALEYARQAAKLEPSSAQAQLCLAVSYGKLTDFVNAKTKILYSRLILEHAKKSLEMNPKDDFAWHVLGRWHQGVANVNPVLRSLANVTYGGLPPASTEEAIRHLKKAVELAPEKIIHRRELARVYVDSGQKELAREQWKAITELPPLDGEDVRDKKTARDLLREK